MAGRWTEARWLRLGDQFLTKTGKSATVSGLTIRLERVKVYNQHVDDLQLYAVGEHGVLVHNKEGIYWFRAASGRWYVGQSGNVTARLAYWVRHGKLPRENLHTIRTREVLGGKRAREQAEGRWMDELGGLECLENKIYPPGYRR